MKSKTGRRVRLVLSISLLLLTSIAWWQRQALYDWTRLRNYVPPTRVVQLADANTMSDRARHIFYVNHPILEDKETFNNECPEGDEQTIVLGCYIGGQHGIHIFDVTDERLQGVEEVTAAHEMLHAAYDRLSSKERESINKQLTDFYNTKLADERVKKNVEAYRAADAGVVPNELHSIFATEIRDLTPELETYYAHYFTDRIKIVAFSEQYEGLFESLKQQIIDYEAKLTSLKAEITTLETQLEAENAAINQEDKHLEQLLASNQIAAYNAAVPPFNKHLASYNASVAHYQALIKEYNQTLASRDEAAVVRNDLRQSINSKYEQLQ